jgi:plastocyanin
MQLHPRWLVLVTAAALVSCSSSRTGPSDGGGGGGGGGAQGSVTVGNIFFRSAHNGTQNPAVDTVAAGSMVTWTWTNTGSVSHSVESEGSPGFASSQIVAGDGTTYAITFSAPGTYEYDCAVHGQQMTGRIVVQ